MNILQDFTTKEFWRNGNHKRFIIVHHTASNPKTTLARIVAYFKIPDDKSVHYVVGKDGKMVQMVRDQDRAWHCGRSQWKEYQNLNHWSIGIEVLSDGYQYTDAQREAVIELCAFLCQTYCISIDNILRHADIALPKGRKWDIGPKFFEKYGSWKGFQDAVLEKIKKLKF